MRLANWLSQKHNSFILPFRILSSIPLNSRVNLQTIGLSFKYIPRPWISTQNFQPLRGYSGTVHSVLTIYLDYIPSDVAYFRKGLQKITLNNATRHKRSVNAWLRITESYLAHLNDLEIPTDSNRTPKGRTKFRECGYERCIIRRNRRLYPFASFAYATSPVAIVP